MLRFLLFLFAITLLTSCTTTRNNKSKADLLVLCDASDAIASNYLDSIVKVRCNIMLHLENKYFLKKETPIKENTFQLEFRNSTDVIFIKTRYNIDDSAAVNILKDKQFLIDNLFKVQPSPYPDQVSNAINCPDSMKPVTYFLRDTNNWIFAYRLFANNRYVYGECADNINEYISVYLFTYSHDFQILNEIRFFTPKSNPTVNIDQMLKKICVIKN